MAQRDLVPPNEPCGPAGRTRLYNQDCVAGMREYLDAGSVDVVVTSPPYNLGIDYSGYDDSISREDSLAWTGQWAAEVRRVLPTVVRSS